MNAMTIPRGAAWFLCFALWATTLPGQETNDEPKAPEHQNRNLAPEEDVRKLKAELEARMVQFKKMQADLEQAMAERELMSAELQKLHQSLEAVVRERKSAEDNVKGQAQAMMARMIGQRDELAGDGDAAFRDRLDSVRARLEEAARAAAADAMKRAADTAAQVARQAEGAASKLDEAKLNRNRERADDTDRAWKKLLDHVDMVLTESHRNEEVAARFLPKVQSAVTQLRTLGRHDEANQLESEADRLLGRVHSGKMRQGEVRPEKGPAESRPQDGQRGWGNVERAVDDLRQEVEQLRREVRDLRQSLQRGPGANEPSRQEGERRQSQHRRDSNAEVVGVGSRFGGEVLRLGASDRPIQLGDRVKKGEPLVVFRSKELADQMKQLVDAQQRLAADVKAFKQIEAAGADGVPVRELMEVSRAVEAGEIAVKELLRAVRSWPVSEEALDELLTTLDDNRNNAERATLGEWLLAAPADGIVVERSVSPGEVVSPGDVLFQIKTDASDSNEAAVYQGH